MSFETNQYVENLKFEIEKYVEESGESFVDIYPFAQIFRKTFGSMTKCTDVRRGRWWVFYDIANKWVAKDDTSFMLFLRMIICELFKSGNPKIFTPLFNMINNPIFSRRLRDMCKIACYDDKFEDMIASKSHGVFACNNVIIRKVNNKYSVSTPTIDDLVTMTSGYDYPVEKPSDGDIAIIDTFLSNTFPDEKNLKKFYKILSDCVFGTHAPPVVFHIKSRRDCCSGISSIFQLVENLLGEYKQPRVHFVHAPPKSRQEFEECLTYISRKIQSAPGYSLRVKISNTPISSENGNVYGYAKIMANPSDADNNEKYEIKTGKWIELNEDAVNERIVHHPPTICSTWFADVPAEYLNSDHTNRLDDISLVYETNFYNPLRGQSPHEGYHSVVTDPKLTEKIRKLLPVLLWKMVEGQPCDAAPTSRGN